MVAMEKVVRYDYIPKVLGLLLQKPIANQPYLHGSFGSDCHLGRQWVFWPWPHGVPLGKSVVYSRLDLGRARRKPKA